MLRSRLGALLVDSGPVVVLAAIAAAGSFTHIRDTASEHGQRGWMAWAVAVCIDLTCVMAARERQRDRRKGRRTGRVTWPTVVLIGGVVLSLAANLAQAESTIWGWLTAATPAGAFLVAVSMLERRAGIAHPGITPSAVPLTVPTSFDTPSPPPAIEQRDETPDEQDEQVSSTPRSPQDPLLDFARQVATDHHNQHGRPITRDALRVRLGVSNQLASDLLRQVRTETA